MKHTLDVLPLVTPADVVTARLNARRAAELLGLDRHGQTRLATAVSEIARNAAVYGRRAEATYSLDTDASPPVFSVQVADRGPGIDGLDAILEGARPFPPGTGTGIVSARRLVDRFTVRTSTDGTVVTLAQVLSREAVTRLSPATVDALRSSLTGKRADPVVAVHEQNRELIHSLTAIDQEQAEATRLNRELEETNRGVVALYSELELQAEQLRGVSEMKSRFLSQMSHECRTPLNSILALARLLRDEVDGPLSAEQKRQIEYIRRSAQTLLEMVNDLLDLAKVEAGKVEVAPARFDVAALFASLRGLLRPLLMAPDVELAFDEPGDLPPLYNDEAKVAQILRNFISNALKFTERGRVQVTARADPARGEIVFAVADTGIGIAPAHIEYIFEEFSQVAGRLQKGGTGLGLPLSRRLAMLLGGRITVASRLGEGSTFTLVLPLVFGAAAPPAGEARAAAAKRVLVMDDEEAFRYIIRHIAQDAGYDVLEAGDGETGTQLALDQRPDIIVLDLHMPRMDGFTALAKLAGADARPVPVIVCTSRTLTAEQTRALSAAYAIVPKSEVSRDGLAALMRAVLEAHGQAEPSGASA